MIASALMVSEAFTKRAEESLRTYAMPIAGLQMALITTLDGFEIASLGVGTQIQTDRLAAMASSLVAMAGAVGREIRSLPCKRLSFEAADCVVLLQSVDSREPCILCLIVGGDNLIGHLFLAAREIIRDLCV